jgi:peptide/nickel transport system permease protein
VDISEQLGVTPQADDVEPFLELTPELVQQRRSQGRIIFDRFMRNRAAIGGAVFLVVLFLFCFLGPLLLRVDPNALDLTAVLKAPSLAYPLGTDSLGRNEMARVMAGGQVSLEVGLSSMLMAIVFGVGIGSFAGYFGGLIDNILMRITDVVLAVPLYLLLFVLSASSIPFISNHTPASVVVLIAIFGWTYAARIVRSEFLSLKEREFVLAARTIGAGDLRLMFRHILPNAAGPIIVSATLLVGTNIILESVLSYFNFGIAPPAASWGNLVGDGHDYFYNAPWLVFVPGLFIFLTVLSFNMVGDGLRDALDPYMTER